MTNLNGAGHHNVDDLLASIRTSIADESGSYRPVNGQSQYAQSPFGRRDTNLAQEAAEFELPAIFKPGHHSPIERPNLFGRLSEALKTPPQPEPERNRTVIRFEPAAAGRMIEPPLATAPVRTPRYEPGPAEVAEKIAKDNDSCKRNMASFFDTRMNKLGAMSQPVAPPVVEQAPPPPPMAVAPPPLRQPPVLPERQMSSHHNTEVEDVAAQLMRPILKQWLMENMPKIVEKALRSEAGDDDQPAAPRHNVRKLGS